MQCNTHIRGTLLVSRLQFVNIGNTTTQTPTEESRGDLLTRESFCDTKTKQERMVVW